MSIKSDFALLQEVFKEWILNKEKTIAFWTHPSEKEEEVLGIVGLSKDVASGTNRPEFFYYHHFKGFGYHNKEEQKLSERIVKFNSNKK